MSSQYQKACSVVRMIFNIPVQNGQIIIFGCCFTGDGSSVVLVTHQPCRFSITADGDTLRIRQVGIQPGTALRQGLLVRIHLFYLIGLLRFGQQVMMDTQFHLAADMQRGIDQHIQRMVHHPFNRIFDRHYTIMTGA